MEPSQRRIRKALGEESRGLRGTEHAGEASENGSVGNLDNVSDQAEAEERLRFQTQLLNAVGQAIIATDLEGKILYWNRCAEELYGWSAQEVMGRMVHELLISEELLENVEEVMARLRAASSWSGEFLVRRKDGTPLSVEVTDTPVRDDGGDLVGIIKVSTDVTERKGDEERLRETERRLATLLANTPAMVYRCLNESDWPEEYVSDYALELTGYPASAYMDNPTLFGSLISDKDRQRIWDEVQEAMGAGERFRLHYAIHRKDGSLRFVEELGQGIYDESGGVAAVEGLIYDVTERKRTEAAHKEAEERYRTLVERIPAVTYVQQATASGTVTYVSPQMKDLLGYEPEECTSNPEHWQRIIHPEDRERVLAEDGRVNETGETFSMEYRQFGKDGRVVWVRDEATLVRGGKGEPLYWLGVQVDVSERRATETALRESEERFRRSFEDAAVGMALVGKDGRWLRVNQSLCEIVGYTDEELLGKTFQDITHPEDLDKDLEQAQRLLEGEVDSYQMEKRYLRKDGSVVWILLNGSLVRDEEGGPLYFIAQVQDISGRRSAEERLRGAEERYRTLVEQIPAVTYVDPVDNPDVSLYTSPHIERMLGYTPEEWIEGRLWPKRLHPDDRERVLAADERFEEGSDEVFDEEYRLLAKDGSVVWVSEEAVVLRDGEGKPLYWQGIIHDVTERREAEEALRRSEERYRNVVEEQTELVCRFLPDLTLTFVNSAYQRYFGKGPEELIGRGILDTIHDEDRAYYQDDLVGLSPENPTTTIEDRVLTPHGMRWLQWTDTAIFDGHGRIVEYQSVGRDVTERREAEERLEHQALHDPLTGLPNRTLFADRLGQALSRTRRQQNRVAVMFMDLDEFKVVNDSLGHEAGDLLLTVVAQRLRRCLRPEDTLARFGGDEFVVLIEAVADPAEAVRVAERITDELGKPFSIEGRELFVAASIGIALGEGRTKSPADLLRDADTAMYRAKDGSGHYSIFDPGMYLRAVRRLELENDLRRALERDEFVLRYQPIVHLGDGRVRGLEALVRWNNPERGFLNPDDFVPLSEESGLVVPMGEWVLEEACRQLKEWQGHIRRPSPMMSVNVSAKQLRRPDLFEKVERALRKSGLDASCLTLDVTETAYVEVLEDGPAALDRLRAMGVRISIDDFGTGYSSLSYLKRLPTDALKIDKSYVSGLGRDPEDTALVRMIVELAHTFGMEVVAEGVETEEQATLLEEMGCDMAQGYLFSEPVAAEGAANLLDADYHRKPLGGC